MDKARSVCYNFFSIPVLPGYGFSSLNNLGHDISMVSQRGKCSCLHLNCSIPVGSSIGARTGELRTKDGVMSSNVRRIFYSERSNTWSLQMLIV